MKRYDPQTFRSRFEDVGVSSGDIVLVHSALFAFGRPEGIAASDLPALVYRQLESVVGPTGTIAVPTFTFAFCKGVTFSPDMSPSSGMGVFSEYVRTRPDSVRTPHPMQSLALTGRRAKEIAAIDTKSAFSQDGIFGRLAELDATLLLVGAEFRAISVIHFAEEKFSVPYRYWKSFTAGYVDNGIESDRTYAMYVRSLEENSVIQTYPLQELLRAENLIREAEIGSDRVAAIKMRDYLRVAEQAVGNDPRFLVPLG